MNIGMKTKMIVLFIIIITFLLSIKSYKFINDKTEGNWIIKVVDNNTGERIENVNIVITDIGKNFTINSKNNVITLPQKPFKTTNKGKYPYGYTIITFSKGYLPRIDHNLWIGKNSDTNILIELDRPEILSNVSYTEFFHGSSQSSIVDFLNYYIEFSE